MTSGDEAAREDSRPGTLGTATGETSGEATPGAAAGAPEDARAGTDFAAIATYRLLLDRYRRTLDLVSPRAFADLDRYLAEAERYAAAVGELAPAAGAVLDLGSGAGLPGVVVAARLAPREVWWVERRRRRTAFLTQVAAHAALGSVRVVGADVRTLARPPGGIAAVTAQAVGSLLEVATLTHHLWGPTVLLVSRKGPAWPEEVAALDAWWRGRPVAAEVDHASEAYDGSAGVLVRRSEPLGTRGTLVAVELRGG